MEIRRESYGGRWYEIYIQDWGQDCGPTCVAMARKLLTGVGSDIDWLRKSEKRPLVSPGIQARIEALGMESRDFGSYSGDLVDLARSVWSQGQVLRFELAGARRHAEDGEPRTGVHHPCRVERRRPFRGGPPCEFGRIGHRAGPVLRAPGDLDRADLFVFERRGAHPRPFQRRCRRGDTLVPASTAPGAAVFRARVATFCALPGPVPCLPWRHTAFIRFLDGLPPGAKTMAVEKSYELASWVPPRRLNLLNRKPIAFRGTDLAAFGPLQVAKT